MREESLTNRVRAGVGWSATSVILSYALALVRSIIIARLLAPGDFGLFGMAATLLGALASLTNMGLDASLIARKFSNDEDLAAHLNTVWTAELVRRFLLTLLLLAFVFPAAKFYGDARLILILPLVSLTPLIEGFQNIGLIIFRKRVSFRRIVWFEQTSSLVSALIALTLAVWTRNVWALVLGQLLSTLASVLLSYLFHPYRPRLAFDKNAFRQTFNFGKHMLLISLTAYITTTVDNVLLGKWFGAMILGVYVLAYNLASLPVNIIGGVVGSVVFPAYAELKAKGGERLEAAFERVLMISAALLMIVTVPLLLLADEIVLLLYGAKWAAAAPLLRVLALIGFWRGLLQIIAPLIISVRGPAPEAKAKTVEALGFLLLLYPLTKNYGALGAAWAGVIIYLLTILIRCWLIRTFAPGASKRMITIVAATLCAGLCGVVCGALALTLAETMFVRLIFGGAVSIAVMIVSLLLMLPDLRREAGKIMAWRLPLMPEKRRML
ncbi:MAG TPA: lipopolysaccharide biosynthesis protein [Pyrinomonadaceae bacterium]